METTVTEESPPEDQSSACAIAGIYTPPNTDLLPAATISAAAPSGATVFRILCAISLAHFLNDVIQALLPSIYPVLQASYHLTYTQVGLITFTFQCTASLLQPLVGLYTDRRPMPYSLAIGMTMTLAGLVMLSLVQSYPLILLSAAVIGIGSSVFHPEASRIAHMAAGKRRGLAQSLFQVGGNAGSSAGPLLAALIIVPHGQRAVAFFTLLALGGIVLLWRVGGWQRSNLHRIHRRPAKGTVDTNALPTARVVLSLFILAALIFSKYFYLVSITNYYTFYLRDHFGVSVRDTQYYLFLFLFAVAAGTILGGPVGDRIGRKRVIWVSILGVAPFSLLLPHVGLGMTAALTVIIGLILASAFSAILVYAQELLPGRVGMIAGLFFGFAFGMAGIGAALLGMLADHTSIEYVFQVCAWLPLIGVLTVFLPDTKKAAA
ncbi:MAG TPA: MFS transporter [Verrucomicrobiales bacterium]|jgi:FSR family fosmidomycin resistance protein-like MFS transporter|nr:MFS transporter [Verrucomicrobiales bacterium]